MFIARTYYVICAMIMITFTPCTNALAATETSLSDLLASIKDTTSKELLISSRCNVDNDLNLPASVNIRMVRGGVINISAGKHLRINGSFEAGLYQVFDGQGQILFGSGSVNAVSPEWWGAKADYDNGNGTDLTPYLYSAAASFGGRGGCIKLAVGKYRMHDTYMLLKTNQAVSIIGSGNTVTQLWYTGSNTAFYNSDNNTIGFTHFKDFAICKYGFTLNKKDIQKGVAFNLQYCKRGCYLSDIKILGFHTGIITKHSYYTRYNGIVFEYNNYPFIIQAESNNLSIINCVFENSKTHLTFDTIGTSRQISIRDSSFEAADNHYLIIRNSEKVIIDGNYFEVYNSNAGTFDVILLMSGSLGTTISNNYMVVPEDMSYTGNCIKVNDASYVDINSNLQVRKSKSKFISVNRGSSSVFFRSNRADAPLGNIDKGAVVFQ